MFNVFLRPDCNGDEERQIEESAAGEDDEGRLEARREAELRAARRKLSKFVVDHERHNLKPDDAKMKRMHAEIKRIEGTVQVRSSGTAVAIPNLPLLPDTSCRMLCPCVREADSRLSGLAGE